MHATKRFCAAATAALALSLPASAQDSALTYQGDLLDGGAPADGTYSLVFTLWDADAGGSQVGPTQVVEGLAVTDGLLAARLDFGPDAFNSGRWLEIAVNGSTLSPRQAITFAPEALRLRGVSVDPEGFFGVNTPSPVARWHVEQDDAPAVYGESLGDDGVVGVSAGPGSAGILGRTTASSDYSAGILGVAESALGTIYGGRFSSASSGNGASGVLAQALASTGNTYGVQASVASPGGTAVGGYVGAGSGGYAVKGTNTNPDGYAGYFVGRLHARDQTTIGRTGVQVSNAELFGVHTTAEAGEYGGMYVSGQNGGALPFYGYSASGTIADAWTYYDGGTARWHLYANGRRLTVDRATGYVGIGDAAPSYPLDMASGAHCTTGGTWTNASSRGLKEKFEPVDARDILDRVAALPITEWSYKSEEGVRHLGPVAEDFSQAFGLGDDDKSIGTVDADGVALAAIQGLSQVIAERDAEIASLNDRLDRLEARVRQLAHETQGGDR
ncbi:MAG: tail fiber domain-containing protein [Phycisphaerales bacterium]|nr:tail fiber domain-containing protein [Phycisphaerales bacterium]